MNVATVALHQPATPPAPAAVTSAAYLPPNPAGGTTSQLSAPAQSLPTPQRSIRKVAILLGVLLTIFAGLGVVGFFVGYRAVREKVRDFTKDVTVASGSEAEAEAASLKELRYPDSKVVSTILKGDQGGRLVTMETNDPFDKVADYYREHIKSPNPTVISDESVLLGFPDGFVTITKSETKTTIFVAFKAGQGIGASTPPIPPNLPTPTTPTPK